MDGFKVKVGKESDFKNTLLITGRAVFMGYLKNEEKTKEAFDENYFFYSKDVVSFDEDNFLTILGRTNDIITRNDGRKVYPLPIERRIQDLMPCLSHCVVAGEGEDFMSALLVFKTKVDEASGEPRDDLDQVALNWCRNLGVKAETLSDIINAKDPRIKEEIKRVIDDANKDAFADKQFVQKWIILPRDFSIKFGELGSMFKLKRKVVYQLYKREIDALYE